MKDAYPHVVGINDRSNKSMHKLAGLLGPKAPTPNASAADKPGEKVPLSHYDNIDTSIDPDQDFTGYTVLRKPASEVEPWVHEDTADVDIHIGDIVTIEEGQTVPCDLIILAVGEDSPMLNNQRVVFVDTFLYDEFTQQRKQYAPEGNPWGSNPEALQAIKGEVLCKESDADLFGFEGVLNITSVDDQYHVNKEAEIPWEGIQIDIKRHFLPRGCKVSQGTINGLAIFVGPECVVSKYKIAEHKKQARIRNLKNRVDRSRKLPATLVPQPDKQPMLTDAEKLAIQEQDADDYDTIADKRDRRLSAQKQRMMLAIVFTILTLLITAAVIFAMWMAVESSKPPPPPPVSLPRFGDTSPWITNGEGTDAPGASWSYALSVVAGDQSAMLYFNEPADIGNTEIIDYTIYTSDGASSWVVYGSPATVTGLTNDQSYTFYLVARNKMGTSDNSKTSASVTPHDITRSALYDLYTQCQGTNWWQTYNTDDTANDRLSWANIVDGSSYSTTVEACKFAGVTCSGPASDEFPILSLEIAGEGTYVMAGKLPDTIGNIKGLQSLNLYGNALTGNIPSSLGGLRTLSVLYLNDNQFVGAVPTSFKALTGVQYLNLAQNALTSMPMELDSFLRQSALNNNNCKIEGGNNWQCPLPEITKDRCATYPPVACN